MITEKPMEQAHTKSPTQGFQLHSLQTAHMESLFGLCNEQYFVQIRAATKKMFNTRYISSPVQGA